ncbi:hypothetical protein LshimejAT787_2100250 [Lyophyllum shimeji]|uniref:Uncharacterized protein n=1 Tax=Lyophyllum shimeji TaxID=47721 RepID=A0A9P3UUY8_LYOSH|nr:hypothetical protein LshimejAT787_2100250 [Lyophyllum shimeji]
MIAEYRILPPLGFGADASFFGLFDPSTKVSLFSKNTELFNKCLGAQKGEVATVVRRRGPNCTQPGIMRDREWPRRYRLMHAS